MARTGENIYKRKDGRWEARYIVAYDSNGKAKYKYLYARTYTEVKAKLLNAQNHTHFTKQNDYPLRSQHIYGIETRSKIT